MEYLSFKQHHASLDVYIPLNSSNSSDKTAANDLWPVVHSCIQDGSSTLSVHFCAYATRDTVVARGKETQLRLCVLRTRRKSRGGLLRPPLHPLLIHTTLLRGPNPTSIDFVFFVRSRACLGAQSSLTTVRLCLYRPLRDTCETLT